MEQSGHRQQSKTVHVNRQSCLGHRQALQGNQSKRSTVLAPCASHDHGSRTLSYTISLLSFRQIILAVTRSSLYCFNIVSGTGTQPKKTGFGSSPVKNIGTKPEPIKTIFKQPKPRSIFLCKGFYCSISLFFGYHPSRKL